jgi:hypothetical protein
MAQKVAAGLKTVPLEAQYPYFALDRLRYVAAQRLQDEDKAR